MGLGNLAQSASSIANLKAVLGSPRIIFAKTLARVRERANPRLKKDLRYRGSWIVQSLVSSQSMVLNSSIQRSNLAKTGSFERSLYSSASHHSSSP